MKVKKLATVYLIDFMIHNNFRPTICKAEIYRIIEQLYFYSSIESVSLIRLCYIYFPFKHNYNIFNKYILAIFLLHIIFYSKRSMTTLATRRTLEKAMAPHSSTLAWEIPWMEEPGRLQSMGLLRVGHD